MKPIRRSISESLKLDLDKKVILLVGPRQVGKTTLSKSLFDDYEYLNYDNEKHRAQILKQQWDRSKPLVIFDEIHKMPSWKRWIKGIFDTSDSGQKILVTGSARLDTIKKMGDSLAGRHFTYHLMPLDFKEIKSNKLNDFQNLIKYSGFPEPFFEATDRFQLNWQKSHNDLIIRQDLLSFDSIRDINSIELLVTMLKPRVSSPLSYNSLAIDLQRDPKTIQKWMMHLENLFLIFKLVPFSKNIARSVLKEPKYYFFDFTRLDENPGGKIENIVALSLKKEVHFLNEVLGIESELFYLKQKGAKELDFYIKRKNLPDVLIEVKSSDSEVSPAFNVFDKFFSKPIKIQLVLNLRKEFSNTNQVRVLDLVKYLSDFDLSKPETI